MVLALKTEFVEFEFDTTDLEQAIGNFLEDFCDLILQYALDYLKKETNQITSNLLKSGRVEFDRKILEGVIRFTAPYAAFVEFGTRPHTPPLGPPLSYRTIKRGKRKGVIIITEEPDPERQPLDFWAWRLKEREGMHCHLGGKYRGVHTKLGWGVWKKIREEGSDPHPYLRPAIDKARVQLPILAKKYGLEYG